MLEAPQQVLAQRDRVLQRLQAERVLVHPRHAERRRDRAGRQHEVVVGQLFAVGGAQHAAREVTADDLRPDEPHRRVAARDAAHRVGDVGRLQAGGRDLVEQRLEEVVVAAVDDLDGEVPVAQAVCQRQPPEAGPDDDEAWGEPRAHEACT